MGGALHIGEKARVVRRRGLGVHSSRRREVLPPLQLRTPPAWKHLFARIIRTTTTSSTGTHRGEAPTHHIGHAARLRPSPEVLRPLRSEVSGNIPVLLPTDPSTYGEINQSIQHVAAFQ